jgi:hypothetical protein
MKKKSISLVIPGLAAVTIFVNPIFIPRHCDVVKRKRLEAHKERCRKKN